MEKDLYSLIDATLTWADDRGITTNSTAFAQSRKIVEEANEVMNDLSVDRQKEALVEIGDVLVTCIITADLLESNLEDCLHMAYTKIKDRKGHLNSDGIFVKDENPDT